MKIWGITTFMPHSEPVVVAAGAENLFSFLLFYVALQRFDVLLESIHACRGNAAERAGHFSPKGLFDRDVAGFLQFVDLYAQVARRSSRLFPDENEVGLFDQGYAPAYFEDVDLCWRLRRAGYRVSYRPDATLAHQESLSSVRIVRAMLTDVAGSGHPFRPGSREPTKGNPCSA